MVSTGITRRIDGLGRIVLPKEFRKSLNLNVGDLLETRLENDMIIIQKHNAFGINEKMLNIYISLIKKNYGIDVYITNNERVICSTNTNKLSFDEIMYNNNFQKYQINPQGDLLGYIIVDNNKKIDKNILNLTIELINNLFL